MALCAPDIPARCWPFTKEKALALPGVVVFIPRMTFLASVKVGHLMQDWDTTIPVGEDYPPPGRCHLPCCGGNAGDWKAKKLVEVEYEPLKPVFSPTYAAQPFAPQVHESGNLLCEKHVSRGNADQAIRDADYVLMYHYETPYTEHAFLEPECAVASRDEDGVTITLHRPGNLRHRREGLHHAGPSQGKGSCDQYAGGRRLWRQGGYDRAKHHAALIAYLSGRPVR